jgi:dihydroxyacid dehydratase/phosphogluconate dehydratase
MIGRSHTLETEIENVHLAAVADAEMVTGDKDETAPGMVLGLAVAGKLPDIVIAAAIAAGKAEEHCQQTIDPVWQMDCGRRLQLPLQVDAPGYIDPHIM